MIGNFWVIVELPADLEEYTSVNVIFETTNSVSTGDVHATFELTNSGTLLFVKGPDYYGFDSNETPMPAATRKYLKTVYNRAIKIYNSDPVRRSKRTPID